MSTPTRRVRSPCCPRAVSGHAAAPPSSVINWRLRMLDKGFLPPWCRSVYPMVNLMRRGRQVVGDDLNCSESMAGCALQNGGGLAFDHAPGVAKSGISRLNARPARLDIRRVIEARAQSWKT